MKKSLTIIATLAVMFTFSSIATAGGPPAGQFWADGALYKTVITPSKLPMHGPKDGLIVIEGLSGQNPVSESKPGDADYNGGRWQVQVFMFTEDGIAVHDANNDGMVDFQLTSWEMVHHHMSLGHIMFKAMGPSFVCPLIK